MSNSDEGLKPGTASTNEKKLVAIDVGEFREMMNHIEKLEQLFKLTQSEFSSRWKKDPQPEKNYLDEAYFHSYSRFGIHYAMLSDEVRTSSYRKAIEGNSEKFAGKVVLDVGCGTSILSMFASRAGARHVIAIDQSEIIYQAIEIAERNGFRNIQFVKSRLEGVPLDVEKVDIIVSEWMGYFLLFEGMLDSVIYARKHFLRPGGLLLPNRCTMSVVGFGDVERHAEHVKFWEDVQGFDMRNLQKECLKTVPIEICKPEFVLTKSNIIRTLNLQTVELDYSDFKYKFDLEVVKDGSLTSIVGYFDTFFDLPNPVSFSTAPSEKPTHWKQTIFYFKEALPVKQGEHLEGLFICRRAQDNFRSLNVTIKLFNKIYDYVID